MGYREFNGTENYLDESAIAAQSQKNGACVCFMVGGTHIQKADWASLPVCPQGCPEPPQWLHHSSCRAKAKHVWLLCHICRKRCYRSRFGSTCYCNTWRIQKKLKTEAGLIVLAVRKGSQADCAGIMRGDVLVSFGRKPITRNALETCVIQWESLSPSHWIETETCWRSTLRRSDFQKKYKKINQHVIDLYITQHRLYVYITLWNRIAYKILFWRTQKSMSGCVGL